MAGPEVDSQRYLESMATDGSRLAQHFLQVATFHALEVLSCDHATSDQFALLVAAEHAGACVELSSKSVLADQHPTLVLDSRLKPEHWELVMDESRVPHDLIEIRTLDASVAAIKACLLLGVDATKHASHLLAGRNAAVHMGVGPMDIVDTIGHLTSWLRALIEAGVELPSEILLKQESSLEEVRNRAHLRLTMAKLHTRDEPDPDLLATFAELEEHYDNVDDIVCPACGRGARLFQTLVEVERYYSGGDELLDPVWEWDIRCPYCRLELGDAEIEAADIKVVDYADEGQATV